MAELAKLRCEFSKQLCGLVVDAETFGFNVALGRDGEKHEDGSMHFLGLANDLLLYNSDFTDLLPPNVLHDAHMFLHDLWDKRGGAPRIINDLNHYSFVYRGRW